MPAKTKRKAKPGSKRKYRRLTRLDPTRTVTLRRAFAATLRRQFARLKAAILLLIDKEDAFGLKADEQAGVRIGNANPEGCNQYTGPGCGGGNDSNVQEKPTYSMVRLEMRMPYGTVEQRQSGVLEVYKNASKEQLRNLLKNINQDEISLKGMVDFDGTSYVWEVPRGSEGVNHSRLAEHLGVTVGFSMRFFVDQGKDGQPLISTHAGIQASGMVKKWADEQGLTANTRWRFSTSPEKLKEFQKWLREQFGSQVAGKNQKDLWQKFIEEGFRKGSGRSFDDVRQSRLRSERPELFTPTRQGSVEDFYQGSRDEFLRSSFARPETIEKVQLLAERVYSDLDGITEEMGARMSRTLAEGLTRGQHPNEIARALADEVDIGRGRAETIARTECLPGDALVDGAVVRTIFRRWYVGSMFEIETKNGSKLSATANHPVLTIRGWVSASRLQQGDHLIRSRRQENLGASGNKNVQGLPAKIGEIFESLRAVGVIERIRGSKDDFHGDGTDSDVEVLRPNGHLKVGGFSPLYKHVVQLSLESTRHLPADLLGYCASCSGLLPVDQRVCLVCGAEGHARLNESVSDASPADVKHFGNSGDRSARQVQADDFLHVDVPQLVGNAALIPSSGLGLGIGPNGGACLTNSFDNPFTVVSIPAGDFLGGYPGEVEIDEVVSVRIRKFTGYVYNLETVQGYYTTQGYYTGNCIRAHAEGQLDSFKTLGVEEVGVAVEWATANDDKVCPKCQSLEGIVLKIDEARGLLPRHPNCLLPGNFVQGRFLSALKAGYAGEAVELVTDQGARLTLTVNHPVLTEYGFTRAGEVEQGQYLACYLGKAQPAVNPDIEKAPTKVEELFDSFPTLLVQKPVLGFDFNGDEKFMMGEVDVVLPDLSTAELFSRKAEGEQQIGFVPADNGCVGGLGLPQLLAVGHPAPFDGFGFALGSRSNAISQEPSVYAAPVDTERLGQLVGRFSGKVSAAKIGVVDPDPICFQGVGSGSDLDISLPEPVKEGVTFDSDLFSQLVSRFPGQVALCKVVEVRRFHYSGPVYDLETTIGYFIGSKDERGGIIIKNCRCAFLPANVGEVSDAQTRTRAGVEEALEESGIDDVSVDSDRPESILNAFCPTGEGGGQDNSCSSSAGSEIQWPQGGSKPNTVWRVQPKGSALHSQKSRDSNDEEIQGVFVFQNLNELAAIDWMNEKDVELVEIMHDPKDLWMTRDQEGVGLRAGKGRITARMKFKDVRAVREWAEESQSNSVLNADAAALLEFSAALNAFCPTGPGGGQDNSCSPGGGKSESPTDRLKAWDDESTNPSNAGGSWTQARVDEAIAEISRWKPAEIAAAMEAAGISIIEKSKRGMIDRIRRRLSAGISAFDRIQS